MLDYAANAVTYWNLDSLRESYEDRLRAKGDDPEHEVAVVTEDPDADYGECWERAKTNLRAGRIRLVFVADVIPPELQRVVEFLNERMSPTEVLAVEIRQYTGEGGEQVLVPRVLGQTVDARLRKTSIGQRPSKQWDEASFLEEIESKAGHIAADAARSIFDWSRDRSLRLRFGKGAVEGTLAVILDVAGTAYRPFYVGTTNAKIEFNLTDMQSPLDTDSKKREFIRRLNEIEGVQFSDAFIGRRPWIHLSTLANDETLTKLFEAIDWFLGEARKSDAAF